MQLKELDYWTMAVHTITYTRTAMFQNWNTFSDSMMTPYLSWQSNRCGFYVTCDGTTKFLTSCQEQGWL